MATTTKTPYSLSLSIGKETFKSKGATGREALANLEKPGKILAKGLLTIKGPEGSRELLLQPARLKRLFFNSAGVQEVLAKQLFYGLWK